MHEMSLIRPVVDLVLKECGERGVTKANAVHLTVGSLRDVIEDYMQGLFQYLARGTVAENAKLVITRVPAVVICNQCGTPFPISTRDKESWTCPQCGAYHDYRLYRGNEFRVDCIEAEGPTEGAEDAAVPAA